MKFKTYPSYKDSGVEWLGEVSDSWNIKKLKYLAKIKNGQDQKQVLIEEGGYPIYGSGGEFGRASKYLYNQKTVLLGRKGTIDKPLFIQEPFWTVDTMYYTKIFDSVFPKFFFYQCVTIEFNYYQFGSTVPSMTQESLHNNYFAVPNFEDQVTIANFLDRETHRIDDLVEEKNHFIELLKEKRQALISHVVTKGLDPTVKMKDSGVEWLGEVPDHWKVTPLKHQCSLLKDGTHLPPQRVECGVPLLSVRNITDGKLCLRDDDSMISEESYQNLCRSFIPFQNDVLLAVVGATIGKTALVPFDFGRFHIQRSVAIFRPSARVECKWLNFVFQSQPFQQLLWEYAGYSAQPGIYLGTLANFRLPIPPIPQQIDIINFLDNQTTKIDALITETQNSIALLKEHRTALISAAVTGKIDVREVA